jgi:hypothetical protein
VSLVTLNDAPCMRMLGEMPSWGRGFFDLDTTEALELTGGASATVKIADLAFACTVLSGGSFEGKSRYRVVAGKGGWGKDIPAKPYNNDAGVKVSTVLRDAATACGETMGTMPTTIRGPHFARDAGTASDILHLLAPRGWYVDRDGVTQIGAWPAVTYTGDAARTRVDLARGVVELAAEALDNLLPGVTVDGHGPASDVEYELSGNRLAVRVYFARRLTRQLLAFEKMVTALLPGLKYMGVWEYRVVSQSGQRFNLQPVRPGSSGMPDLRRVPTRGHPGIRATVALGERVLVAFADQDPFRPNIVAHDAPDAPGWMPSLIEFGEGADFFAHKSAVDALQQALDTHVHPHALGPTSPTATPIGPQDSSELVKGD